MILDELKAAIVLRDYGRVVEMASTNLGAQHHQHHWASILDYRAFALGMQSKFEAAVNDAQKLIISYPTLAKGYVRLGSLYEMQGKQLAAINNYNIGLQTVTVDKEHYYLILKRKEIATKCSERRVDFLAKLPVQISNEIIMELPKESKLICLNGISRMWRKRTRNCAKAWSTLQVTGNVYDMRTVLAASVTIHVENLTIDTSDLILWKKYIIGIRNGRFENIKTLCMTAPSAKLINMHTVAMLVTNAFYQISSTLTTLELHHNAKRTTFLLAEVLFILSNLKRILYTTTKPFSDNIGQFSSSKKHTSLVDVQLKASPITGSAITPFLLNCPNVRRLVLDGCHPTVIEAINSSCPALEILGYNSDGLKVPAIDSAAEIIGTKCLREFYTRRMFKPELASTVLPLIHNNMKTLETLSLELAHQNLEDLDTMYTDLKFDSLTNLTLWGDYPANIQSLILRSISSCTKLTRLSVRGFSDMPGLVNTLIAMPRITSLELAHILKPEDSTCLVQLFKSYASISDQCTRTCETIKLEHFAITDECLVALADIDTIKDITLIDSRGTISVTAMDVFFGSLMLGSTTHILLSKLDCVNDKHLSIISGLQTLKSLHLDALKNVTDNGIVALVSKRPKLRQFTIKNCNNITQKALMHTKRNIKYTVLKFECL